MAAITASAISKINRYVVGDVTSKVRVTRAQVAITLSAQGATAGDITATLLGFKSLSYAQCYRYTASGEKLAGVSTDGTNVFTFVAFNAAPANLTGVAYLVVEGIPL